MNETNETPQDSQDAPSGKTGGKLGLREKLAIGTGGLPLFLGNNSVNALAMPFYNMILGVPTAMLGFALMIPRIWDAFTDPFMGNFSDNFRSRFGRRRPFILLGAILMGLTFGAIWMVPVGWGNYAKTAWFVVTNLLFYTSFTIFSVPFISLTYEMSPDYDERTSIQGFVTFWSKAGELLYQAVIPLATMLVTYKFASAQIQGIRIVTGIYAALGMGVLGSLPAILGKERYYELSIKEHKNRKDPFWKTAGKAFQNKPFAILCGLSIMTMFAAMFASCMDYYLLVYYMFEGDVATGSFWKLLVTIGYATVGFACIPIVVGLCKKLTKIRALEFVYCLMILNAALRWFIFKPGNQFWIWLDPLTGGIFWIGVATVMQSMIADVCDDDEVRNGHRREGIFGALFGLTTKLAIAVAWAFAGVLLGVVGFDATLDAAQAPETFLGMRLLMVIGATIPAIICFVVMTFYPLTKEKAEENRKNLEERRGAV